METLLHSCQRLSFCSIQNNLIDPHKGNCIGQPKAQNKTCMIKLEKTKKTAEKEMLYVEFQ